MGIETPIKGRDGTSKVSRLSGCDGTGSRQTWVKFQPLVDHALGGETFTRAGVSKFRIGPAHRTILVEHADAFCQAGGVICAEIQGGIAPDLSVAWNIISHDRATRERRFQGSHAERFVTGSRRVNRGAAI